jgi:hypothetical protein
MLRPGLIALLCALTVGAAGLLLPAVGGAVAVAPHGAPAATIADLPRPAGPRVLLLFLPAREKPAKVPPTVKNPPNPQEVVQKRINDRKQLSIGLIGATQGPYNQEQFLLDLTSGTRTSTATYDTNHPWPMRLSVAGTAGFIDGWLPNKRRALAAPASIKPGLLSSSIPGGGTYVGFNRPRAFEAAAAADEQGTVRRASIGPAATVGFRAQQLLQRHRFVVVSLPPKRLGGDEMDQLLRHRAPNELIMVMQAPPDQKAPQLLPIGLVGERGHHKPAGLTSQSTRQAGVATGIDIAPTILKHLGIGIPSDMRGEPLVVTGARDSSGLKELRDRLTNIGKYRLTTVQGMVLTFIGMLLALAAFGGWHRSFRKGLRIGSLSFMWAVTIVLFEALFNPSSLGVEMAIVAIPSFALGILTERYVPWPYGPVIPIFTALTLYSVDLANDSHLIVRSLLGPNPKFGSRFFGVGNEMEAAFAVMALIGIGAALTGQPRSRRNAGIFAIGGAVLAVIIGSGRLGADVGGIITVGTGTIVAAAMMLPHRPAWWKVAAATLLLPVVGLAVLAVLDLVTGGNGHFTRNVLQQGSGNFLDTILRRFELAFNALFNGRRMPFVVAAGAIAVGFAYRNRAWLYGPVPDPSWRAALIGGLTCSIFGSLANDSGPLLFVVGAFGLIVATCYIQGDPRLAPGDQKIAELREEVPADGRPPPADAQPPPEGTGRPAPTIPSPTAT